VDEKENSEPYKEEISDLLSLVRIALYIMAAVAGVGLSAQQIGLV
jgi:peptide deformylase